MRRTVTDDSLRSTTDLSEGPTLVFLAEPPHSPYDLNFHFAGVSVRVHPLFWLFTAILGGNAIQSAPVPGVALIIWIGAVFFSVLVHELGHSLAMRYYGSHSHIVLYSMGGLAIPHSMRRHDTVADVTIALAGPFAGFALAAVVIAALLISGNEVEVDTGLPFLVWVDFGRLQPWHLHELVTDLLVANIYYGIINLLPVFPLDGGQATRAIFNHVNPGEGLRQSLYVSIGTAAFVAYLGFTNQQPYLGLMFGLFAYNNYQMLQQFGGPGSWR